MFKKSFCILSILLVSACASNNVSNESNQSVSDAVPIVLISPAYPKDLLDNNISGYVVTSFTVNERGRIEDVKVIESEPEGVFDRAAVVAMEKFLFKPKKVNGKNVASHNVTRKFTFSPN